MKPPEEFNLNSWQQDYLLLETKRFEVTLKHFFEIGVINQVDYQFLTANLKMMKSFLKARSLLSLKKEHEKPDYWSQPNKFYKKHRSELHPNSRQASLFDVIKPIPITGEIVVSGLNESLQALKNKESEKSGPCFPYKISAGTHWNNVIIKFQNDERVEIYVRKLKHTTDYKGMGMIGKGNIPTPSEQWIFLKVLAQCNGEISIKDSEARDKYKKQKQALTEILQKYFSIDYDPFYPYKTSHEKIGNSYKIKLTLIPPPAIASQNKPIEIEEDTLGIQEFLSEEAPQVIED